MDKLNAFITRCSETGIPIKDNFCTQGIKTTAASKILDNFIPPYNATVVQKLLDAGYTIMGKTNMDAFAHGSSTETSDYGVVKNPWDLNRVAGGSSGGSAAVVASGISDIAIGSETAGSIRGPAAWCGIVGLKPSYGRVSRYGLISMCSSTDSPGPLAKTVAQARDLYHIIAGPDEKDATTRNFPIHNRKTKTIGLPREYFSKNNQKEVNEIVMRATEVYKKTGIKFVEVSLFDPTFAIAVYTVLQRSEVSSNLARFDGIRYGYDRNSFNDENKRRIMLGSYTLQAGYYDEYYQKAQKVRSVIIADFEQTFAKVDLLLAPTMPTVAPKIGITSGQSMYGELADVLTEPSAIAGLPAISIPCGFAAGLPVGLQLIGPAGSEEELLNIAEIYEQATDWHKRSLKL